MTVNKDKSEKSNIFIRIIHDPVAIISLIIGFAGILIAIFVPLSMRETYGLSYAVNPVKTQAVVKGQATGLEVVHNGVNLGDTDITIAQVAIWNSGDLSIRPANILKDVIINLNPPVSILDVSISKYYREQEITGFTLKYTSETLTRGSVPVTWDILENSDGASVQIIYLGSANVSISVDGLVEGAGNIARVESGINIQSPEEQVKEWQQPSWVVIYNCSVGGFGLFFSSVMIIRLKYKRKKDNVKHILYLYIAAFFVSLFLLGASIYLLYYYSNYSFGPPFGF